MNKAQKGIIISAVLILFLLVIFPLEDSHQRTVMPYERLEHAQRGESVGMMKTVRYPDWGRTILLMGVVVISAGGLTLAFREQK